MNAADILTPKIIMPMMGFVLAIIGFVKLWKYVLLKKEGTQVEGVIDELIKKEDEGNISIWPIVTYKTLSQYSITKKVDVSVKAYQNLNEGDRVTILYNEKNPESFIINDNNYMKAIYGFIIPGVLLIALGLWVAFACATCEYSG